MCGDLATESVESAALSLEGVHHVHGRHGLASCVLGVGHSVTNDILQEGLEHSTCLLVDGTRDTPRRAKR